MLKWDKERNGDRKLYVISVEKNGKRMFYRGLKTMNVPVLVADINKARHMNYGEAFGKAKNLTGRRFGLDPELIQYDLASADTFAA